MPCPLLRWSSFCLISEFPSRTFHQSVGHVWLPASLSPSPHSWSLLVSRCEPPPFTPGSQGAGKSSSATTVPSRHSCTPQQGTQFSTCPAQGCSDSFPSPPGPTCMTTQIDCGLSISLQLGLLLHKGYRYRSSCCLTDVQSR